MFLCAECKRKSVYIDNTGQPAEFCSNQCRKTAVEQRHVQPCIKCRTWPMVRLPDGSRSPFCGKHCQNLAGVSSPVRPMPLQQQPPYRPAMMTSPQLNQSNSPIGMPPHPIQVLPGGSARPMGGPMGGPWVMATVPFCRNCHVKPCWKDTINQTYSSYCSRTCKEAAERGAPRVVSNMNNAPYTSHQNYNVSPVSAGSPVSPVLQTNGILPPLYHHQQPPYQQNNIQQQSQLPNFTQQQQQQQQSQLSNFTQQQQFQQPQPQNPSNNIQHPRPLPSENPLQTQMNDNSQYRTNNNSQRRQSDDIQQSPASNSSQNSQASGHHIRYHNTDTPISHPQTNSNSQPSDSQTPPPIPTNKPTVQIHPQHINPPIPINITINTSPSSSQEMHPPSPPLKKIPDPQSPPQAQIQEQNQPHSPVQTQEQSQSQSQNRRNSQQSQSRPQSQGQPQLQSQSQSQSQPQSPSQPRSPSRPQSQQLQNQPQPPNLAQQQNHSQPQPQLDGIHPEINGDSFILTPYVINQDDPPPQYTPNDTYAPSGEDISIRKVTRDDSFDDENPYGFRNVNNNNSNDQDNNNPEQRTQHNPSRWRRL